MSHENVEIVRRSTAAYIRRDLDGMLEYWASDALLDWSNTRAFDAGVYRGHGEIRAFIEGFLATWDEVRFEFVDGPV
jgi:ketosteroid isomerase-like protein